MNGQSELWIILDEEEEKRVWKNVYRGIYGLIPDVYDIDEAHKYSIDEQPCDLVIRNILIECMGDDDYMYALDEYHTCYRYNPKSREIKERPTFIPDNKYPNGGYNAYFPNYYPNGDYYYFIGKDLNWGYWGAPWDKRIYVYGECLKTRIQKHAKELDLLHYKKYIPEFKKFL